MTDPAPHSAASQTDPDDEGWDLNTDRVVRDQRIRFSVPVEQPLVLISQVQRSGGTLMTQLLDGHPELHVLPIEPHLAKPKWMWPELDLTLPTARLFKRFGRRSILRGARRGFAKLGEPTRQSEKATDYSLPFIFVPRIESGVFSKALGNVKGPLTQRDVVAAYFAGFFNGWLDYQGLYTPPAQVKHIVAFMPRLIGTDGQFEAFRRDYPEGKVIVPLRDPVSWYASARRHAEEYENVEEAAALWTALNLRTLEIARAQPRSILVVPFEAVVNETERVMRRVAEFLGIAFHPSMLVPTFNRIPTVSNSSFDAKAGLDKSAAERRTLVEAASRQVIERTTGEVYAALRALAVA